MFLLFFFLYYLYKYFINCLKYSISICYLIIVYGIRCVINTHNFQYIIKYLLVENHDLCFVKTFSIQLPVMKKIKIINYNKYKQTREYTPLTIPIKNRVLYEYDNPNTRNLRCSISKFENWNQTRELKTSYLNLQMNIC